MNINLSQLLEIAAWRWDHKTMKPFDSRPLWILLAAVLTTLITEFINFVNKLNRESQIKSILWRCSGYWNIVWWSWLLQNTFHLWSARSRWWIFSPFYSRILCCITSCIKRNVKVVIFIWLSFTARYIIAWFVCVRGRKNSSFKILITISV